MTKARSAYDHNCELRIANCELRCKRLRIAQARSAYRSALAHKALYDLDERNYSERRKYRREPLNEGKFHHAEDGVESRNERNAYR